MGRAKHPTSRTRHLRASDFSDSQALEIAPLMTANPAPDGPAPPAAPHGRLGGLPHPAPGPTGNRCRPREDRRRPCRPPDILVLSACRRGLRAPRLPPSSHPEDLTHRPRWEPRSQRSCAEDVTTDEHRWTQIRNGTALGLIVFRPFDIRHSVLDIRYWPSLCRLGVPSAPLGPAPASRLPSPGIQTSSPPSLHPFLPHSPGTPDPRE